MLTGATRYRTGLFGSLILQVQEIRTRGDWFSAEEDSFKAWRDARVEDLLPGRLAPQGAQDD